MEKPEEKNLQLERLVFFSDAVVAIAITLLALDIKIEHIPGEHLTFSMITAKWQTFAAFFLSFINIATYWKTHHTFFVHIKKIDERLLWANILWLFFIVLLPFSTSLIGVYSFDTPAIFTYSLNLLLISVFQNMIWDYSSFAGFSKQDKKEDTTISHIPIRLYCNLDMINCIIAIVISFFSPVTAFILLFTKLPLIILARFFFLPKSGGKKTKGKR
ncbi:MAG: hypothetical protein JWP12_1496 [Bacteroidetes bacterium]|nr:hypothetical protein [Bacteroidota bacterium]